MSRSPRMIMAYLLWVLLCGAAWPATAIAASCTGDLRSGKQEFAVTSGGKVRTVLLAVPALGSTRRRWPLVIDLHGSSSNGAKQAASTRLGELGGREGFVVANPSGGIVFGAAPEAHYWNIPGVPLTVGSSAPVDAPDDVQFIGELIDQLVATGCIDRRRVYVAGMSGGARMTSWLACQLATRIAAVAPVAGLRAGLASGSEPPLPEPQSCQPQRPMPIITFHGTDDRVNPYPGGGPPYWRYGFEAALDRWVQIDHCRVQLREQRVSSQITRLRYGGCAGDAEIVVYRIEAPGSAGGGHSWPGGRAPSAADLPPGVPASVLTENLPSTEISATDLMWKFFARHRLPAH